MKRYATIFALLLAAAVGIWLARRSGPAPDAPQPPPATQPAVAIAPAEEPDAPPPPPPQSLLDVVRELHPRFPTTQPLPYPVKFAESARLKLDLPLYIDPRGDLWITHPNAAPISQAMASAATEQTHVVPVPIAYVRWAVDTFGTVRPWAVTWADEPAGGFEVIAPGGARRRLPRGDYLWSHAMDWQDATVVPTPTGVSVLHLQGELSEQHFDFLAEGYLERTPSTSPATQPATQPIDHPIPQLIEDTRGILAFIPWDGGHPGSTRIARYVDGQWQTLPTEAGDEQVLHLIPLLDGSLIRLLRENDGKIRLRLGTLDAVDVPRDRILALVDQLSDLEQENREAAMDALRQYGQGIWPILEQIVDDQPPEARIRIRQLLKDRIIPTLAGMTIIENRLEVVARQADRTILLYAPQGISRRSERDELSVVSPAWIVTGPSTGIRLLDPRMTHEMDPSRAMLQWVAGDWIAGDPVRGPRIWVGNDYLPLLDKDHAAYRFVQGVDRAGRWLFVRQAPAPRALPPQRDVLVVDRRLPDPTPRLPVWVWSIPQGQVGWDSSGWPAMRSGGAYALEEAAWRGFDPEKEGFFTDPADAPPPGTSPTAAPSIDPAFGQPLLVTTDGRTYYGGTDRLMVVDTDGDQIEWLLPPSAAGDGPAHLVQTADDRLFLYNQAGRIVRIAPTPGEDEPFVVEAVFTRRIPNVREIRRMWLDPAGRIILMASETEMAILFPEGRIPRPIALLMPAGAEDEQW